MIKCKLCGLWYDQLGRHLVGVHGIDSYQYRKRFPGAATIDPRLKKEVSVAISRGLAEMVPAEVGEMRRNISRGISRAHAEGVYEGYSKRISEGIKRAYARGDFDGVSESLRRAHARGDFDGAKAGMSELVRDKWANDSAYRRAHMRYFEGLGEEARWERMRPAVEASHLRHSGPEKVLGRFLEGKYPGLFIPQWERKFRLGRRYPDFYSSDGHKIVIESMGEYFHPQEDEDGRVSEYKALGWKCVVVWASCSSDIIVDWPSIAGRIDSLLLEG